MSQSASIYHQQRARQKLGYLLESRRLESEIAPLTATERQRACQMVRNHLAMSRALRMS